MADENRTSSHPVTFHEQLEREPYTFDFFQAVRRMDCANPDKPQTGHSVRVADDTVRFGQEPSLAFPPATLESIQKSKSGKTWLMQRFFGLFGPQGPLPLHLTEYIRERVRNHSDFTLVRFLNIFHHRMVSFFYRAWARVRPTVSFDAPEPDRFGDYVGTLMGMGMDSLANRDALSDLARRHFAGHFGCQTRHAEGLLAILTGYFRLPIQLQEFIGQWIELPENCRCLLGKSSCGLGENTTIGSHVWDCQQKFRVIVGPLSLRNYYRMLPGGSQLSSGALIDVDELLEAINQRQSPSAATGDETVMPSGASLDRMISAVRSYVGDELQWDLQLILRRRDTPPLGLGLVGRLGWSSWLIREHMTRDPDDLVLDAMQVPENVEQAEFSHIRRWDERTLGQTREGERILAEGPVSSDVQVTEVDVAMYQVAAGEQP